jgi:hypothetical protein
MTQNEGVNTLEDTRGHILGILSVCHGFFDHRFEDLALDKNGFALLTGTVNHPFLG